MKPLNRGLNPADSEIQFLEKVAEIETYGVDLHHAYWVREVGRGGNGGVGVGGIKWNDKGIAWPQLIDVLISYSRNFFCIVKHL